jgi:hypothetical protein
MVAALERVDFSQLDRAVVPPELSALWKYLLQLDHRSKELLAFAKASLETNIEPAKALAVADSSF